MTQHDDPPPGFLMISRAAHADNIAAVLEVERLRAECQMLSAYNAALRAKVAELETSNANRD